MEGLHEERDNAVEVKRAQRTVAPENSWHFQPAEHFDVHAAQGCVAIGSKNRTILSATTTRRRYGATGPNFAATRLGCEGEHFPVVARHEFACGCVSDATFQLSRIDRVGVKTRQSRFERGAARGIDTPGADVRTAGGESTQLDLTPRVGVKRVWCSRRIAMFRTHLILVFLLSITWSSVGACADRDAPAPEKATADCPTACNPSTPLAGKGALAQLGESTSDIAERTVVSVVNISSHKVVQLKGGAPDFGPFFNDPFFRRFFDPEGPGQRGRSFPRERRADSLGSGVIVDANGTILTNNHVIEDASEVKVTLADGRRFDAKILGADPESDIGVLKLEDPPDDLEPLPFGDSDKLRLGSTVLAIGNPFGVGQTVTMGIVSTIGRANVGIVDYENFIQTDAAINPGNSGGALINNRGELVGINTAILSRSGGYQGIGFAIPSNMASRIMKSLVNDGKVIRGWLGVMIQDLNPDLAAALDLPKGTTGALVSEVVDGSPAEKGGVEAGDVIVGLSDEVIDSGTKLRHAVAAAGANVDVELKVLRDGKHKTLEIELTEREPSVIASNRDDGEVPLGGLSLAQLNSELARRFGLPADTEGVIVVGIDANGNAAAAGFQVGDVIIEANRTEIASLKDFRKAYDAADDGMAVLVQRGKGRIYLVLKVG